MSGGDCEILPDLLEPIEDDIERVSGDGAYDTSECYDTIRDRGAKPTIPPRKNAVIRQHGNCIAPSHPRDEALRYIRKHGRKMWKQNCGPQDMRFFDSTSNYATTPFTAGLSLFAVGDWIARKLPQWVSIFWALSTIIGFVGYFIPGFEVLFVSSGVTFGIGFARAGINIWKVPK
jgi:hypothetical protein